MQFIALVTILAFQNPLTPRGILDAINLAGAAKTVSSLLADETRWDSLLASIGTGEPDWLTVAARLGPAADGHASETLNMALQEALPKNPTGVLQLVREGIFTVEDACGMYGFGQIEDQRPVAVLIQLVDARLAAVETVTSSKLATVRESCLRELRGLRQVLQKQGPAR